MKVQMFDSYEEMQAELQKAREAAEPFIQDWQRKIKTGDYFIQYDQASEIIIYHQVRDVVADEMPHLNLALEEDRDQLAYVKELAEGYVTGSYRAIKAYSPLGRDGELGTVHLTGVGARISKLEFDAAKEQQWPQDRATVLAFVESAKRSLKAN